MISTKYNKDKLLEQLFSIIDNDIKHLRQNLHHLDELRVLVVKRDDQNLANLLEVIRNDVKTSDSNKKTRTLIIKQLSQALGCENEHITLNQLAQNLPPDSRTQLLEKKQQLKNLIARLKAEHVATVDLLTDCERFNRLLLNAVFKRSNGRLTYNHTGASENNNNNKFVDMKY